MGQARTITTAPILPARPEYGAPRNSMPGTSDAERLLDGCRILLPPPRTHSSIRYGANCVSSDRPLDLTKRNARETPETTPMNRLINLTREFGSDGEAGEAENPVEAAEENEIVDVTKEVDSHI